MEKKYDVTALGELLIDFAVNGESEQGNQLFEACPGGAPCNVLAMLNKLGRKTAFIGKVGDDQFGKLLKDTITNTGIEAKGLVMDKDIHTTLAFVHTFPDGDREFSFYRKPGADMLMEAKDVDAAWFQDAYALHFCSVSLGEFPMKEAHRKAIDCARRAGCMISFDPNIRLPLWENPEALRNVIWEFAPMAHVLKISDEELEFITGKADIKEALPRLFAGNTRLVIYTKGADGAECYTERTSAYADGQKVKAVDTTGAGDGFIGAFLFCMAKDGVEVDQLASLSREQLEKYLAFANKFCAKSITKYGAIASYPTLTEM